MKNLPFLLHMLHLDQMNPLSNNHLSQKYTCEVVHPVCPVDCHHHQCHHHHHLEQWDRRTELVLDPHNHKCHHFSTVRTDRSFLSDELKQVHLDIVHDLEANQQVLFHLAVVCRVASWHQAHPHHHRSAPHQCCTEYHQVDGNVSHLLSIDRVHVMTYIFHTKNHRPHYYSAQLIEVRAAQYMPRPFACRNQRK